MDGMLLRQNEDGTWGKYEPYTTIVVETEEDFKQLQERLELAERMQWIPCGERLPEGCEDAELEILVYTEEKYIEAEFKEVGFALYYPSEKKFRSVYNHRADITENVVAWMPLPKPYKQA